MRKVAAILTLLAVSLFVSSALVSGYTFHGDEMRSGNFTDYGPESAELVYKIYLGGFVDGSPVVSNNRVFVLNYDWSSANSSFYCINATTGEIIWKVRGIDGMSTPAIAESDGLVFVHAYYNVSEGSGKLYAFYAENGTERWNVTVEASVDSWCVASSPLVYNNSVYVLSYYGTLYRFNFDGNEIWNLSVGDSLSLSSRMSSPSAWNGTIYFIANVSNTYKLIAVDESGYELWNRSVEGVIKASPALSNGIVYLSTDSKLHAFNASNGEELWNASFDGTVSTPAVSGERLYVGSNSKLYCINATTGEELWNFTANGKIDSSPAIAANNIVYFATNTPNGTIYALNATNGAFIWSYSLNPPENAYYNIMSSPFIYNGKLYIGADDGNLYIFGLWKGTVKITKGTFEVVDNASKTYTVSNFTVLGVLQKLNETAGISYTLYNSSGNLYLSSLGGISNGQWITEVNGKQISEGLQFVNVSDGDVVTFWFNPPNASGNVSAGNAPYLVEVKVKVKLVTINELEVSSASRGGFASATLNLTSHHSGWLVVVVSGTNENGDSIAGISTVKMEEGDVLEIPVKIPIPQQVQTGNYTLYAAVYKLSEYPEKISEYTTTPVNCTVS